MTSSTPKLTLSYFPIAGRAEPVRLSLAIGDIPFTNKVLSFPEFAASKSSLPLGQLPTLDLDFGESKRTLTQSSAVLRYVGKLGGLYPRDDDIASMEIDEIISILDDLRAPLVLTIAGKIKALLSDDTDFTSEEKIAIRKRWLDKALPCYLGFIEKKISENSSGWVVGESISIADLALYCELNWISGGVLDGIPTNVLDSYPACTQLMQKVKSHEGVKKWTDVYSKPYGTFDYAP
jgi:glutathione S-transferase